MTKDKPSSFQIDWIVESGELDQATAMNLTKAEAGVIITRIKGKSAAKKLVEAGILSEEKAGGMSYEDLARLWDQNKRVVEANQLNDKLHQVSVGEEVLYGHEGTLCTITAIRFATIGKHGDFNITIQKPDGKKQAVMVTSIRKKPPN